MANKQFTINPKYREALVSDFGYSDEDITLSEEERNEAGSTVKALSIEQINQAIDSTEEMIKQLEEDIAIAAAIENLEDNEDFKIFELSYFTKEKERLASVLTSGSYVEKQVKDEVTEQLRAIGLLNMFLGYKANPSSTKEKKEKVIIYKIDLDNYKFELAAKRK